MKVIIFDTETTGVQDPEVVEAAWTDPEGNGEYCERFLPNKNITLGAMATHHIIRDDLIGCRMSAEFKLPEETRFIVGHNVDFDWKVAGSPDVKRVCTLALSRWLFPEIDSHSQTAMMYHLFPHNEARELCRGAHNALADVKMCRLIFHALREEMQRRDVNVSSWAKMWEASESARIPTVMTFGKHKGIPVKDVPPDYKRWLLAQPDIDPYLILALRS